MIKNCRKKYWLRIDTFTTLRSNFSKTLKRTLFTATVTTDSSIRSEVFCKKSVIRNFAKFTGKGLWKHLFLKKLQAEVVIKWLFHENKVISVWDSLSYCYCTITSPTCTISARLSYNIRKFWWCFYYLLSVFINWPQTKMTDVDPSMLSNHQKIIITRLEVGGTKNFQCK